MVLLCLSGLFPLLYTRLHAVVIKCQVIKALRRAEDDIDCQVILNDTNVLAKYAGVSSDNTSAMRHGVRQATAAIPKLIAVGCSAFLISLIY